MVGEEWLGMRLEVEVGISVKRWEFCILEVCEEFRFFFYIKEKLLEVFKLGVDFVWFRFVKDFVGFFVGMDCKGEDGGMEIYRKWL